MAITSEAKKQQIKATINATRERRKNQECKTYNLKIQYNKLNGEQKQYLKMLFVEAKWFYNYLLSQENIFDCLSLTKLKEVFGSDFQDYFMFNPTSNPNAKVTKNGITVIGPEQTIEFGPWKPSNSSFGVDFAITPFKYRISRIGKTGENNEIEVIGLQKFGFGLSSVDKMPTDDVQSTMN